MYITNCKNNQNKSSRLLRTIYKSGEKYPRPLSDTILLPKQAKGLGNKGLDHKGYVEVYKG